MAQQEKRWQKTSVCSGYWEQWVSGQEQWVSGQEPGTGQAAALNSELLSIPGREYI